MPCELFETRLHPYLDGELDATGSVEFERHISDCPDCASALLAEKNLRQAISSAELYERAPDSLRKNILEALPATPRRPLVLLPGFMRWAALAAVLLLFALFGREALRTYEAHSDTATLAATAVDAHLRSLEPGHLYDVPSSDQHTVKPWFDGKIDFAPDVHDFADAGFPLLGGRLDVVRGQPAAALVYGRQRHIINVFVLQSENRPLLAHSGDVHGYHWLAWQTRGLTYLAVSDVSSSDLAELRALFEKL